MGQRADAAAPLPAFFDYGDARFFFKAFVGRGAEGAVGLYGSTSGRVLALKASHCDRRDGRAEASQQLELTLELARRAPCAAAGLRAPLAYSWEPPCMRAVYDFFPENLEQWLAARPSRSPTVVASLFRQLLELLDCLRGAGVYYTDLKPDNFLVDAASSQPEGAPRLLIGDLGGLCRYGAANVVVTPDRLPPSLLASATWETVDVLTSYLVGSLALDLLLKPTQGPKPLDELFACLQRRGSDCTTAFLPKLRASLADGLALEQPETLALAALALNLTGYRGLFVSLGEIRAAPTLVAALLAAPETSGA